MTESMIESMIEAAAEACYAVFSTNRVAGWDDIEDDHRGRYRARARAVLTAAFAVAPLPAGDDLAGRERTLVYRSDPVALYAYPVAESVLFVEEINGGRSNRLFIPAMFCDAMIEALFAGKPEREKRLAFLRETFLPAGDTLERTHIDVMVQAKIQEKIREIRDLVRFQYSDGGDGLYKAIRLLADVVGELAATTAADGREEG